MGVSDDRSEINIACATEWIRRSDNSLWHVRGFHSNWKGQQDGFTLARVRLASEPRPEGGFQDRDIEVPDLASLRADFVTVEDRVQALRVDLVEAMRGYLSVGADGSLTPVTVSSAVEVRQLSGVERENLMNGAWVTDPVKPPGPPRQPDELTIAAINRSLRMMAEHGGGTPDYVEDWPVKPVAESPYPFVCTSVDDVADVFRRSTGVPVAFVTDVPALRVALGLVTEMEELLRDLESVPNSYADDCPICGGKRDITAAGQPVKHDPSCRLGALLARIDAAKVGT